jgi:hypothetical protein
MGRGGAGRASTAEGSLARHGPGVLAWLEGSQVRLGNVGVSWCVEECLDVCARAVAENVVMLWFWAEGNVRGASDWHFRSRRPPLPTSPLLTYVSRHLYASVSNERNKICDIVQAWLIVTALLYVTAHNCPTTISHHMYPRHRFSPLGAPDPRLRPRSSFPSSPARTTR